MKNSVLVRTLLVAAPLLMAAPALAQTTQMDHVSRPPVSSVYIRQETTAEVTYYNDDPMASSHSVGSQKLDLAVSEEAGVRRQLQRNAPADARWASVRTPNGQQFAVNLQPTRYHLLNDRS